MPDCDKPAEIHLFRKPAIITVIKVLQADYMLLYKHQISENHRCAVTTKNGRHVRNGTDIGFFI